MQLYFKYKHLCNKVTYIIYYIKTFVDTMDKHFGLHQKWKTVCCNYKDTLALQTQNCMWMVQWNCVWTSVVMSCDVNNFYGNSSSSRFGTKYLQRIRIRQVVHCPSLRNKTAFGRFFVGRPNWKKLDWTGVFKTRQLIKMVILNHLKNFSQCFTSIRTIHKPVSFEG